MEKIQLIGRSSRLSLLQIEIVKKKIQSVLPQINVEVITRSSKGDELQNIPLHTVEGSDFFTQDIFDALKNGEADIAVHSLKDMSSEHFFGENKFAVVDRDDTRDVAIFNAGIEEKIVSGQPIIIGTCSPRREEMATVFLKKALPQLHHDIKIETKPIRGNIETRLRKLNNGEYDATILATAGLNRLLKKPHLNPPQGGELSDTQTSGDSLDNSELISSLLADKKLMVLPLIECVPAPCQGTIVAEAYYNNNKAIAVLEKINDQRMFDDCVKEKRAASQYGRGCLQQFGVTTLSYGSNSTLYAAGKTENGKEFTHWYDMPELKTEGKIFFSSTDHMGGFFEYEYFDDEIAIDEPVVYVSNYKAIRQGQFLKNKRVWAAGTKTWYELAKQGIWVEGGADAFGLEFLETVWSMPLLDIKKEDAHIITSEQGAKNWRKKGWKAAGTYSTVSHQREELAKQIAAVDIIFWASFQQYELYKDVLKEKVQHVCSSGETAVLLKAAGIETVIFPNIKAFQQWRKTSSRLHSED